MVGFRHTCLDEDVAESDVFEMLVVVGRNGEVEDGIEWKWRAGAANDAFISVNGCESGSFLHCSKPCFCCS